MNLPQARTTDILEQEAGSDLLIYDLRINKAYNLNETSKIVYRACDGQTSAGELKRKHAFTDDLIHLTLDELNTNNLLENYKSTYFFGLSRREVIRRAGLASMIALPVISSLIAPVAADAQSLSNLALGQTCTSSAQCSSSAPNCANRSPNTGVRRCCEGSDSRFDTGGVVNSCSGGSCSSATFACQADADQFCCSNSTTASCTGNSCACRCD